MNPIGAIAPKGTLGDIMDPARILAKSGGNAQLFDPAGMIRKSDPKPAEPAQKQKKLVNPQSLINRQLYALEDKPSSTLLGN